jgi:hypothetical protein
MHFVEKLMTFFVQPTLKKLLNLRRHSKQLLNLLRLKKAPYRI